MSDKSIREYKFETTAERLNYINSIEAKLGLTHEEFVYKAANFIEENESRFKRRSRGEGKDDAKGR